MRITTLFAMPAILAVTSLLAGCSISYSTGKSSDSISTSLDSISSSSTSGGDTAAAPAASSYAEDVAAATVLHASSQKNSEQFLQTISNIARSHGIVDWEQEMGTYVAMGKGLKRAGVDEQQIAELPYFRTLVDSADYTRLLQGYHQS